MDKKHDSGEIEPKQRILDAAIRLFAKKGYAATGMRELSKEADVNLAMINYYFGTKQKILEEIIDQFCKGDIERKQKILFSDVGMDEKVRLLVADTVQFYRENQELALVSITEFPYDIPEIADYKANYVRSMLSIGADSLAELFEDQLNDKIKLEAFASSMMGMIAIHFIMKPVLQKLGDEDFDDDYYDSFTETITDLLLFGLFGQPDK